MDLVSLIKSKSPDPKDWKLLLSTCGNNMETLTHFATATDRNDMTQLLAIVDNLIKNPEYSFGVAILLAIQANHLPEQAQMSFLYYCRHFFKNAAAQHIVGAVREGCF